MNSKDLKNISNLSKNILSESTTGQESFLDKWPYTAPYLTEEKVCECCGKDPCECGCGSDCGEKNNITEGTISEALPLAAVAAGKLMGGMAARGIAAKGAGIAAKGALRKKLVGAASNKAGEMVQNKVTKSLSDDDMNEEKDYKYKNCGCGKNPCKTYGKEAAPVAESADHLKKVASKLEKASKTHAKQAKTIRGHVKDMQSEELAPHLKKFDADNKKKFLESGKKAQAERQANIDAFKKHKMEVLAKGGRPVDALDSWMQKKLKREDYEPAAKLLESGLFTEEEIIKITIG